jgi:hypothetical protein
MSLKGGAGVTTCAVVCGAVWGAVVVEADPRGGDVAAWMGWPDAGLSELAAAAPRGPQAAAGVLRGCARRTGSGVVVVTAPLAGVGARASVAEVVDVLPGLSAGVDLVVDAGAFDPQSPVTRLLRRADRVLLLVPPVAGELARLREWWPVLARVCGRRLRLVLSDAVLCGPPRFPASQVRRVLGVAVAGVLPYDPRSAAAVAGWPGAVLPAGAGGGLWRRWRWPLREAVSRL